MSKLSRLKDGVDSVMATNVVGLCTALSGHMNDMSKSGCSNSEIEDDIGLRIMVNRLAYLMDADCFTDEAVDKLEERAEKMIKGIENE